MPKRPRPRLHRRNSTPNTNRQLDSHQRSHRFHRRLLSKRPQNHQHYSPEGQHRHHQHLRRRRCWRHQTSPWRMRRLPHHHCLRSQRKKIKQRAAAGQGGWRSWKTSYGTQGSWPRSNNEIFSWGLSERLWIAARAIQETTTRTCFSMRLGASYT